MNRRIKSFVKRERPLSSNQQKIFSELWPKHGLDLTKPFIERNNTTLEIGFGNGETLFSLAKEHHSQNFIGIEVYKPGVISLLSMLQKDPLDNLHIYNEDAILALEKSIPDQSLSKTLILFPDPWPKKRHHKRRLIQPKFIELLAKKIKPEGILHIATDWENYAEHIAEVLKESKSFARLQNQSQQERTITTKFEERGKKLGHQIFDFVGVLKSGK